MKATNRAMIGVLMLLLLAGFTVQLAADETTKANGFAFDLRIMDSQGDFGLGIGVLSPPMFKILHIQAGVELNWKNGIPQVATDYTWIPFFKGRLGIVGAADIGNGIGRLYGGGGMLLAWADGIRAANTLVLGGYGIFGFEFWLEPGQNLAYFIEVGGEGSGGRADRLQGSPFFANGFTIASGVRLQF